MNMIRAQLIGKEKYKGRISLDERLDMSLNEGNANNYLNMRSACFRAKEIIYQAGNPADKVYELKSGLVKLVSYLSNGKQRIVRLHGLNDWIGLAGFLQQSHEHTAIAITKVEANCISISDYPLWKPESLRHYNNLLECFFQNLKKADIWIEQFGTGCIKSRVARLINFLSEVEYGKDSMRVMLLTCEEMAAILGSTTESVSTVLAEFKRSGALRPLNNTADKQYERDPDSLMPHVYG